ncbi:MAG: aminotransferase class V-fold PLP-dependent enzyme [Verrucomicrobium sp.]|nr:aminotransferase class V-fold PLP-dependent enzyme [Verrucomicrobium sp.]
MAEAVAQTALGGMAETQEPEAAKRMVEEARASCAALFGAQAEEIAFVGPTAVGLSLVAAGIDWQPGDEVVYYAEDYPSNVYPWTDLARQGVKPVAVETPVSGHLTPELVFAALTSRTRLVALPSCHFLTGYRVDVKTIGRELARRDILFCVDAIQSLGATPLDAADFDFLSAGAHKWLLGPLGSGVFYVKKSRFDLLRPILLGSMNVVSPRFIPQKEIAFPAHARRYEAGGLNVAGIAGLNAAAGLLGAVGVERIAERLLSLHAYAADLLRHAGFTVLSDAFPEEAKSGIITAHKPGTDLKPLFDRLEARNIAASLRWDAKGNGYLRFSPHFYNTDRELEETAEILA